MPFVPKVPNEKSKLQKLTKIQITKSAKVPKSKIMKYQPFEFSRQKYYYLEELLDELELKEDTPEDILDAFCELAFLSRIGPLLGGDGEL